MTDRHAGYVVTLGTDIREDDAEAILTALRMVKGVITVEPVISSYEVHIAESRARAEFQRKVVDFLGTLRD
jgi:hypothetical protein